MAKTDRISSGKDDSFDQVSHGLKDRGYVPKGDTPEGVTFVKHITPEKGYVRRTSDEFEAGAKPIPSGKNSHRMERIVTQVTPSILQVIEELRVSSNTTRSDWLRAAIRYALRNAEDFDPSDELATEFTVEIQVDTLDNDQ